jgi:hypothetical protein
MLPTCFDLYSDHLQGARSFLVKSLSLKLLKYKRSIMAMWQYMCGVYIWHSVWRCKLDSYSPTCNNLKDYHYIARYWQQI